MSSYRLCCFHHSSLCASSNSCAAAGRFLHQLCKISFALKSQRIQQWDREVCVIRNAASRLISSPTEKFTNRLHGAQQLLASNGFQVVPCSTVEEQGCRGLFVSARNTIRTATAFVRLRNTIRTATAFDVKESSLVSREFRNVVDILEERGLVESLTGEGLRTACSRPDVAPLKVYCGFDPTAESLHLGNLLGIVVLLWFQKCGHIPVAVMGGATARVGDPSGKSVERPLLDEESISRNLTGIHSVLSRLLTTRSAEQEIVTKEESSETPAVTEIREPIFLNNYDWWKNVSFLDFLRDVGKHARVGTMMAKESVKRRLTSEEGMSYTEFTYQLLQGYDFVHLFKQSGISVQIGGSDQWGNITAGTELIRRLLQEEGAYGLTFPLLLKSDGSKFGKSEGGAIWLCSSLLSPYKFYQHLIATSDSDVLKLLRMLTFIPLEEVTRLEAAMSSPAYIPNTAQKRLAEELTRFVHGHHGLEEALAATQALAPGSNTELNWKTLEAVAEDVPSISLPVSDVVGTSLVEICVASGLLASKGAVKRLIKQGGIYLNNHKVGDEAKVVDASDLIDNKVLLLSAGKKNKLLVQVHHSSNGNGS